MTKTMGRFVVAGLMAALLGVGASGLQAGLRKDLKKDLENLKHALGWDTINLKVMARDAAGHPTHEHESNAANHVDRKTSYHANGKIDSQSVIVVDKATDKTLYTGKKDWDERGSLESVDIQDDAYNGDGKQMKGHLVEQRFENGLLTSEVKKQYFVATGGWGLTHKESISYYADGTMKERLIEDPTSDEKSRETWGAKKGLKGRKQTVTNWNSDKGIWQ